MRLNSNEAPDGFYAVSVDHVCCDGCEYAKDVMFCDLKVPCGKFYRSDNTNVIFIKKAQDYPVDLLMMERSRR